MTTHKPLFKAVWKIKGEMQEGIADQFELTAERQALGAVNGGATYAAILRDSQGTDHPDNAGKFFLHRYIK